MAPCGASVLVFPPPNRLEASCPASGLCGREAVVKVVYRDLRQALKRLGATKATWHKMR